jgi:hypothetical protein
VVVATDVALRRVAAEQCLRYVYRCAACYRPNAVGSGNGGAYRSCDGTRPRGNVGLHLVRYSITGPIMCATAVKYVVQHLGIGFYQLGAPICRQPRIVCGPLGAV